MVPSAKIWRNMPNVLPSSERFSVTRVTIGSDSVAGRETRGRAMIRGAGDDPGDAGVETSVDGRGTEETGDVVNGVGLGVVSDGGIAGGVGVVTADGVVGTEGVALPKRKNRPSRLG